MSRLGRWLQRIGWCAHPATYRERRAADGVADVMHWVCADCGAAWPVVQRTPDEHRAIREAGQVVAPSVRRQPVPGAVIAIGRRRRRP